jgi:hypothetical protein
MTWHIAARYENLQAAAKALQSLGVLFAPHRDKAVGYRAVIEGPEKEPILVVAALSREEEHLSQSTRTDAAVALRHLGFDTDLPEVVIKQLLLDWSTREGNHLRVEPNPFFTSTLDLEGGFVPHVHQEDDSVAVTSHAKCRNCGGNRHKIARLNVCRVCWEEIKPQIRAQWRDIKERRRLRRAVEEHLQQLQHQREREALRAAQPRLELVAVTTSVQGAIDWHAAPDEQIQAEIDRIQREGVPPPNTVERGHYMQLFRMLQDRERNRKGLADPVEELTAQLYSDSDVPLKMIYEALGIDNYRLRVATKRRGIPNREDIKPWRPHGRIIEGEKLVVSGGKPFFKNPSTGKLRPVWPVAGNGVVEGIEPAEPELVEPELPTHEPELPTREPEVVEDEEPHEADEPHGNGFHDAPLTSRGTPRKRVMRERRTFTLDQKAEIARWYADITIPLEEIKAAYGVSNGSLDRIRQQFELPLRTSMPGYTHKLTRLQHAGRFELVDGAYKWLPADAPTSQAAAAPTAPQPSEVRVTAPFNPANSVAAQGQQGPPTTSPGTDWVAGAEARLAADQAAPSQEPPSPPAPPAVPQPAAPSAALAVPVHVAERAWSVTYIVQRTELLAAPTIDEALRRLRDEHGQDVDVVGITRA